jgi:DNA-binding response OmpR family regulator
MGLEIFTATSGNDALRLSLKHDFAIVLMDVRMPDMDGFETAELMRTYPKTSSLPIIFVSAVMKDTQHQFKGYESGAFDYLLKPIDSTILRSKVRVFCDLFQQRQKLKVHEQQLETLVSERTAELREANEQLQIELTERKRAEESLNRLNEELEQRVRERTKELDRRNSELEQVNKVFVGRELKMVELKERIKELEGGR